MISVDCWVISRWKHILNNKFQILKLFTESLRYKEQSRKNRERSDENNRLIWFLRGQFLDSKAKTRGIAQLELLIQFE